VLEFFGRLAFNVFVLAIVLAAITAGVAAVAAVAVCVNLCGRLGAWLLAGMPGHSRDAGYVLSMVLGGMVAFAVLEAVWPSRS
jgi:hypothetical protein